MKKYTSLTAWTLRDTPQKAYSKIPTWMFYLKGKYLGSSVNGREKKMVLGILTFTVVCL